MKIYGHVDLAENADVSNLIIASGNTYPAGTIGELFVHSTRGLSIFTADGWVALTPKTVEGSLNFPKDPGVALKIENQFGWVDLIGDITPRQNGVDAPSLKQFNGNIYYYAFAIRNKSDCQFHIPHDYAPGSDLYAHIHWSHNGSAISGSFIVNMYVTYAKGHGQGTFTNIIPMVISETGLTITNTPQFCHKVTEVKISTAGGGTNFINTNDIEVDGIVSINFDVVTIPSISGSISSTNLPFVFCLDLHMQSTGLSTKNKSPNFYA